MIAYIIKRLLYAIPIVIGVNLIIFVLFFIVNTPDNMARHHLGDKHITQEQIEQWKLTHGYDKPTFYNPDQEGVKKLTQTLFYQKSIALLFFNFGQSDRGSNILSDISQRMWPSLALAVPALIFSLLLNISLALLVVLFRGSVFDRVSMTVCVVLMSISSLFYIIVGQYFFGKLLRWSPVSGYEGGFSAIHFLWLPVLVSVVAAVGAGTRWYRTIFLEEIGKDYIKTAYSKGLSDRRVLFVHVLKNGMIPIITGVVVLIPSLFMGSLILESFFGIPGLGSYTIEAIGEQDFSIVRVMVYMGTLLYIIGLILTDLAYLAVDPRVRVDQ